MSVYLTIREKYLINSKPSGKEFSQTLFLYFLEGILFPIYLILQWRTRKGRGETEDCYCDTTEVNLEHIYRLHVVFILYRDSNRSKETRRQASLPSSFPFLVSIKDNLNFWLIIFTLILAEYKNVKWENIAGFQLILFGISPISYTRTWHTEFWTCQEALLFLLNPWFLYRMKEKYKLKVVAYIKSEA